MLFTTHEHRYLHKDRTSALLSLRDKSKAINKDYELEKSYNSPGLSIDSAKQEFGPLIGSFAKYSE